MSLIDGGAVADKMLEGVPVPIRILMAYDMVKNHLTEGELKELEKVLGKYLEEGERLEADYEWDVE